MTKMKYYYKILSIILIYFVIFSLIHCKRRKRNLVYPHAKVQLIFGMGLPVDLEDISVTTGLSIRAYYLLPSNSSGILRPSDIIEREMRTLKIRWNIYKILSGFLERFGGKSCVLRSICEIMNHNLDRSNGFIEELFHTIFRPSTTNDEFSEPMDREYVAAEKIGERIKGSCRSVYPECKFSLIDMLVVRKNSTIKI